MNPFQLIVDAAIKFVPLTVRMNVELPALTEGGLREPREGVGLEVALMSNLANPELPPPGAELITLTVAEPGLAISAALICACSWVLEEKVVVCGLPFH